MFHQKPLPSQSVESPDPAGRNDCGSNYRWQSALMTELDSTHQARLSVALSKQRQRERRRWRLLLFFAVLLLSSMILDVAAGPSLLPPSEVVAALLKHLGFNLQVDAATDAIVMSLRLPIALMAVIVGAALGVGGAEMQTLLNNPMASPYTLGMAAAAGLGAALMLYLGGLGLDTRVAVPLALSCFVCWQPRCCSPWH